METGEPDVNGVLTCLPDKNNSNYTKIRIIARK